MIFVLALGHENNIGQNSELATLCRLDVQDFDSYADVVK